MPKKKKIIEFEEPLKKGICPECGFKMRKSKIKKDKWRCLKCGTIINY